MTLGLIPDLVHPAREPVPLAFRAAAHPVTVITDAEAAATRCTGEFRLRDRTIIVSEDAARLPDGTLAGSVLSMDKAVRNAVRNLVDIGITWTEAVYAATTVPAPSRQRCDHGPEQLSSWFWGGGPKLDMPERQAQTPMAAPTAPPR